MMHTTNIPILFTRGLTHSICKSYMGCNDQMHVWTKIVSESTQGISYLYKVYPPYSRRVCRPSLSLSSPASWAPSSPAWRASSWSWSPPGWAWGWGWPRLSGGAGTCPPCRHDASSAAPAEASHWARSASPPTRGSVIIDHQDKGWYRNKTPYLVQGVLRHLQHFHVWSKFLNQSLNDLFGICCAGHSNTFSGNLWNETTLNFVKYTYVKVVLYNMANWLSSLSYFHLLSWAWIWILIIETHNSVELQLLQMTYW